MASDRGRDALPERRRWAGLRRRWRRRGEPDGRPSDGGRAAPPCPLGAGRRRGLVGRRVAPGDHGGGASGRGGARAASSSEHLPGRFSGGHAGRGVLPAAAVEVIHRVVNDSGRLTRQWAGVQIEELGDASVRRGRRRHRDRRGDGCLRAVDGRSPTRAAATRRRPAGGATPRRRRRCRGVDPDDRGEAAGERVPCAVAGAAHQRDVADPRERVLQPRAPDARPDVGSRARPAPRSSSSRPRSRCSRSASIERRATRRCSVRAAQRSDPRSTYGRPSNAALGSPTGGPSSTSPLLLIATGPIWRPPAGPSSPLSALPASLRPA